MNVIKRDGSVVEFSSAKIKTAISKTNARTNEMTDEDIDRIVGIVENKCERAAGDELKVEEIQDIVEETLLKSKFNQTAKSYILYRDERSRHREGKSKLMKAVAKKLKAMDIVNQNANVDEASFGGRKGEANNEVMKWFALNECMCKKSRDNHENNEIYQHDLDSYSVGQHNCLSIPFDQLLANGFNTRQTDIRPASSINTAFQLVAVVFQLQSLQQFGGVSATHLDATMIPYVRRSFRKHYLEGLEFIGGCSKNEIEEISKLIDKDTSIKDKLYMNGMRLVRFRFNRNKLTKRIYDYALAKTNKELKQAVEGMYHNLNTLQSRSGNQLPFTSINYGACTVEEARMVTKALLEGSLAGVGKFHKTPIFPCGIFQYSEKINGRPGTPNYDLFQLALESTSKRLYPNYSNLDWTNDVNGLKQDREFKKSVINNLSRAERTKLARVLTDNPALCDSLLVDVIDEELVVREEALPMELFSTMGCRTANGYDICSQDSFINNVNSVIKSGKLYDDFVSGAQKDGRGNICPATIIMPTLAMETKENLKEGKDLVEEFMKLLDKKIHEAKDMLVERFEYICAQDSSSAKFMYENHTMSGYVPEEGIRSALRHGTLVIGQLGLAETLQILIGTNQTTKEGMELAKRIEQLFLDRCTEFKKDLHLNFGVYYTPAENLCFTAMKKFRDRFGIIPHVSDREYFTNSIHVPVWEELDPFEKINVESQLTGYSNAGCITYVELEGAVSGNIPALETIVSYAMKNDIPYFAVNVPNDTCLECGFTGEFNDRCPVCGSHHIQRLRRVTGYLTGDYTTAFNDGKKAETDDRVKHTGVEVEE